MNEENICEYSVLIINGKTQGLKCKIDNEYCGRCRWCVQKGKIVMTNGYLTYGCNIKNNFENNQKGGANMDEIKEDIIEDVSVEKEKEGLIEEKVEATEKPKKKKGKTDKKNIMICEVNYNIPKKNKTSIRYSNSGSICSVFINGVYDGKLEIAYIGEIFDGNNIISIKNI